MVTQLPKNSRYDFQSQTMKILTGFLLFVFSLASSEKVRYDGYRVYSVLSSTVDQFKALTKLSKEFDVWKHPRNLHQWWDIMVPPGKKSWFEGFLNDMNLSFQIKNSNVQTLIDEEETRLKLAATSMDWKDYHPLEHIHKWLDAMAKNFSNVKTFVGGESYEGRELKGLEITFGENLTGVFIEGGIHAREWVSPASTTWMVNEIIRSPPDSVVRKFNYVFVPVFNPDGYAYSWDTDRLWRKTRTPYKDLIVGSPCYGADPNRNWDFHWNGAGSSEDPCSEVYAGPNAFSEKSMLSISKYIKSIKKAKKLDIYLSYHSYSQLLLYPWGDTSAAAPNKPIWNKMGQAASKALYDVHQQSLGWGQSSTVLYETTGTTDDWFYGTYNATVSFTFEMRDQGDYGFILPAEQIIPNSEEYYAAFKAVLTEYLKIHQKEDTLNIENSVGEF